MADVMERTDVGMGKPGDGAGLVVEARFLIRILGEMRRENHAPSTEQADDLERPQA